MIVILGGLALFTIATLVHGWALAMLWNWFVTPLGTPSISIPLAIGLSLTIGLFTADLAHTSSKGQSLGQKLVGSIFISVLFVGLGWLIHLFR